MKLSVTPERKRRKVVSRKVKYCDVLHWNLQR